ncbi:FmdB family transcriptional regulator [Acuticoccus sediminis]|uniref:FmdB family transcriptional regulator n=1 Tax=Acuticoccus sediminis TaxID=2184697 RepID=A0A8B2NPZ2_9HYPH|nr:zinc ribbon domain-containing protein [Acuticoccus sediminis]RAI01955.1 FmdB family transcriptional regulator [Acuticoccus sediminis]
MPTYEYLCTRHGAFQAVRPMAESADPSPCPACGTAAPRAIMTAPRLAGMDGAKRHAHATNERSADSPRRSGDGHGPGCGCCSGKSKSRGTLHRPDGSKSFPSARPWMISH